MISSSDGFLKKGKVGSPVCAPILASRRNFDYLYSGSMGQPIFMRTGRHECLKYVLYKNVSILFYGIRVAVMQVNIRIAAVVSTLMQYWYCLQRE